MDKHSTLLRKSVNYGRKFFIVQAPGVDRTKIVLNLLPLCYTARHFDNTETHIVNINKMV